jgi:hypothetical protein
MIQYHSIFNNYEEELNVIFNESYSYFKNEGDTSGKKDAKLDLRKNLKASLGY